MKKTHAPIRQCIVSRERLPKEAMLRFVCINGQVKWDLTGQEKARGAYMKKDRSLIKKLQKKNHLNRVFKCSVPDDFYDNLADIMETFT